MALVTLHYAPPDPRNSALSLSCPDKAAAALASALEAEANSSESSGSSSGSSGSSNGSRLLSLPRRRSRRRRLTLNTTGLSPDATAAVNALDLSYGVVVELGAEDELIETQDSLPDPPASADDGSDGGSGGSGGGGGGGGDGELPVWVWIVAGIGGALVLGLAVLLCFACRPSRVARGANNGNSSSSSSSSSSDSSCGGGGSNNLNRSNPIPVGQPIACCSPLPPPSMAPQHPRHEPQRSRTIIFSDFSTRA